MEKITEEIQAYINDRVTESLRFDSGEDEPPLGIIKKFGYRSSTITQGVRDFTQIDFHTIIDIVWTVWQSNPVASRSLKIKRDYIIGGGVKPITDSEKLQSILNDFWQRNKMDRKSKEFTLQLFLFGIQCITAHVKDSDGTVSLGYIDPGQLETVIPNPTNALELWAVVVKEEIPSANEPWKLPQGKKVFRIIRKDTSIVVGACSFCLSHVLPELVICPGCGSFLDTLVIPSNNEGKLVTYKQATLEPWELVMLASFGLTKYSGDCFYEKVNSVSNQPFGYSDLLPVIDWLDQHDETLFALADREQMAGFFSWDVTMTGAEKEDIEDRAKELRMNPPKKGSVNVHNEKEEWRLDFPDLKQAGSVQTATALLTFILGGLGLPRHWYGFGDETNRATAAAQGDPTWRSLTHDQGIVKGFLTSMLLFQRDQAIIAGNLVLEDESKGAITLVMPEMTAKDFVSITNLANAFSIALMNAETQGWITRKTAVTAFGKIMAELDIDFDPLAEIQAVDNEREENISLGGQNVTSWFESHPALVEDTVNANT